MITENEIKLAIDIQSRLEAFAENYLDDLNIYYDEMGEVSFDTERSLVEIYYATRSGCGCCPDDNNYENFPFSYLYDPNWLEVERDSRMQENLKAIRKRQEEEKQQKIEAESSERKHYLELKEKYDTSP